MKSFFWIAVATALTACAQQPVAQGPPADFFDCGYSMHLTGYDVPRPEDIPFDDPIDVREYLAFYHAAYLEHANSPGILGGGSLSPISPRPRAAVTGHNDGQLAAMEAKERFWQERRFEATDNIYLSPHVGCKLLKGTE